MRYGFGPFLLDTASQQLWREGHHVTLQPRPLAVLIDLLAHAGEVVNSATLLSEVWGQTRVGKAALKVCIRAIREALGDDTATPRYIETVRWIGYRVIVPVTVIPSRVLSAPFDDSPKPGEEKTQRFQTSYSKAESFFVGREVELEHLQGLLRQAQQGARQLVFVTGEPGIGKTAVIDRWLESLDATVWVGRGECLEQYSEGEAYLPVLEAVGQLCRGPGGLQALNVLRHLAPAWLAQLPRWVTEEEVDALQSRVPEAMPARMLREMAEALEVLATRHPLVLVVEDLHWSDRSTLDLLAYLAQRRERAQLCVIGTYRPIEAADGAPPLLRLAGTLRARKQCVELQLSRLSVEALAAYLQRRFSGRPIPGELAAWIYRRSEGNALFMVALAEYYEREGRMADQVVPVTLQQLIAHELERLSAQQQRIVEEASVAGVEFGSAVVAAGLGIEPEDVDEVCAGLVLREQMVQTAGVREWPDGTLSGRYRFRHALYQQVVYQRLPELRRVRMHRQMGARLEAGYGERAQERAVELAMHFERGRVIDKAVQYYHLAAENALRRSTYQEAVLQATKGLALVETLPRSPARFSHELPLQTILVSGLMATKGHASQQLEQAFLRARDLCEQAGDVKQLLSVLLGLFRFSNTRGELQTAYEYAEACLALAGKEQNAEFLFDASYAAGTNAFYRGALMEAQSQIEQGLLPYDPEQHQTYVLKYGFNPYVSCLLYRAAALGLQGYQDQATRQIVQALETARELDHPYTLVIAHILAAVAFQLLRQEQAVVRQAEAGVKLATKQGFPFWVASGTVLHGWSQVAAGKNQHGIQQIKSGLASMQELGACNHRTHYLTLLAEAVRRTGDRPQALQLIEEALIEGDRSGERFYAAEAWRIKGEVLLMNDGQREKGASASAEACFSTARELARQQQARSLELRAATSLARLWQRQKKKVAARRMLAQTYRCFAEGFGTKDLREAKALLDKLSGNKHREAGGSKKPNRLPSARHSFS